jgi:hypothetical protein
VRIETQRDLEDILLPGGHPGFEDRPFDADSEHLFADAFQVVPAGCYDVVSQPLTAEGEPSSDCAPASESGVQVTDGQTTEIMLINQCGNDGIGALDAIAVLNHAPQLVDVRYEPSKFTCGDSTRICVTATDPDNDPLQLVATGPDDVAFELLPAEQGEDGFVQCVEVTVPQPGEYTIDLTVYDLMYDAEGNQITIESALDNGLTSNDTLAVPVHAMDGEACVCDCPEGFELNAAGDTCERIQVQDAVFNGENLRTICENDESGSYGARGARFPDGTNVTSEFFGGFPEFENRGRLTAAGVWSCENTPNNEWIGFSRCVDIEEPGGYVIGIGGDNEIRVGLNGEEIFYLGFSALNFESWWMIPVELPAGVSLIELEGLNYGGPAGFAAEIYGPFPVAQLQDDASMAALDYANNIVWSTGDQLGGNFDLGESVGYACEDGFALDLCGDVATCTRIERQACNE